GTGVRGAFRGKNAPMSGALPDAGQLVSQASELTGLDDLGDDTWRDGLGRLLASLEAEARLNDVGVQVATGDILSHLTNRLGIVAWRRDHPEVARGTIRAPLVIVGQPRTGTTILYDLLAQDPADRAPLTWEVDRPCPSPETATYGTDPRIDEVQAQLDV